MNAKTTHEKAEYLIGLFGKTWLQNKLQISQGTLVNRLSGSYGWTDKESKAIDGLYESPVKKIG